MKPIFCSLPVVVFLTANLISARADNQEEIYQRNWPQWRGPTGNGVALRGNPPIEWSEEKNVKWKARILGNGHSTPVIWEDKIFVLAAVSAEDEETEDPFGNLDDLPDFLKNRFDENEDGELDEAEKAEARRELRRRARRRGGGISPNEQYAFTTLCLNRETGEVLWKQVGRKEFPHEGLHETNSYSSGSPVTDGERVISFFGSRGLYCYDLDGNLVWEKDLGKMKTRNGFGEGSSPTLYNDVLVVLWDNEEDSYVYAFDKETGEELWRKSRDERTGWTTPYALAHNGAAQVVINATNAVRGYDLNTGELLWECSGQTDNAIPSIVADRESVYAMSGYRGHSAMSIKLGQRGNLTGSDAVRWAIHRGTPYVPSPLLYDGWLYFCQRNDGILTCVDAATGEPFFSQERIEGISGVYASPVGVNNRIYLAGREGATVVLEKAAEIKILARNELNDSFDASPAIVGDELFLRGHEYLYCIAEE